MGVIFPAAPLGPTLVLASSNSEGGVDGGGGGGGGVSHKDRNKVGRSGEVEGERGLLARDESAMMVKRSIEGEQVRLVLKSLILVCSCAVSLRYSAQ